jgi:hypothetical protein
MVSIENNGSSSLLIWQPCRVERKETGRIVADATRNKPLPLRGTNSAGAGTRLQMMTVELPGTNHLPWRLLVPVSRYEVFARGESLFRKPLGTWINKFPPLASLLRRSQIWVASDWFDESTPGNLIRVPPPQVANLTSNEAALVLKAERERLQMTEVTLPTLVRPAAPGVNPSTNVSPYPGRFPPQGSSSDTAALMSLLRTFQGEFGRWPTNFAETASYGRSSEHPISTTRFDDATFSETNGTLRVTYNDGRGRMSLSGGGGSSGFSRFLPPRPVRAGAQEPFFAATQQRQEESRTFTFILRNFHARHHRWPANIAEVKAFAMELANLQPEFPSSYDTETYSNAVFTIKSDGGLQMSYRNGTMTVGAPK